MKNLSASHHRRVLAFLNEATRAEDLMFEKLPMLHFENAEGAMIVDEQANMKLKEKLNYGRARYLS